MLKIFMFHPVCSISNIYVQKTQFIFSIYFYYLTKKNSYKMILSTKGLFYAAIKKYFTIQHFRS